MKCYMYGEKYTNRNIVVNIPEAENENIVFIAMPFSKKFDKLHKAIESAVIYANLTPRRIDKNPEDPHFIKDITSRIRTARIVIAVCSPEPSTKLPNPNVMYELGMAQSIGKCTIIMTTEISLLPSNLRDNNVLVYSPEEVDQQYFVDKLTNRLNKANSMVKEDGLTATYYKDIFGVQPHHWLFLDRTLWGHYVTVLSFTKDVHHYFQLLTTYIDPLLNKANNLYTKPSATKEEQSQLINDYQLAWKNYSNGYDNISDLFLNQLPKRQVEVEEAFQILRQRADYNTKESLDKSNDFYVKIKQELLEFNDIYSKFREKANKGLIAEQFDSMSNLSYQTDKLSHIASNLLIFSDSMIQNLINVFDQGVEL